MIVSFTVDWRPVEIIFRQDFGNLTSALTKNLNSKNTCAAENFRGVGGIQKMFTGGRNFWKKLRKNYRKVEQNQMLNKLNFEYNFKTKQTK